MGLGPSKEKIRKILEKSINNQNINTQSLANLKIEYKYKQGDGMDIEETVSNNSSSEGSDFDGTDSFNFSQDETQNITSPVLDVKNPKKFPYITIGRLQVRFPQVDYDEYFTCFLIDTNVVITLASNLENANKGGRAKIISTTFSEEKVKPEILELCSSIVKEQIYPFLDNNQTLIVVSALPEIILLSFK